MAARPFSKVLIANRGEIACRIARTAKAAGYRTVAVFSDADEAMPHVHMADEAVRIGKPPPSESYLNIGAILDAARRTGADAIHPGYGFLAENADFAEACIEAGLVFIGPAPETIRVMGDKAAAKERMEGASIPCVPGYFGSDQGDARLKAEAKKLGFPLLIKAVSGGGGRGIRAVLDARDFEDRLSSARREAKSAFGDDCLMLERLIEHPRHIEVQVLGDTHGNVVHLYERDCTTQRRRQKLIEEAPSPVLTPELREKITGYAVSAAKAVGYQNAGTVEFIADERLNIYFLEMNTRLQVEHPVTEMITGLDLVEWQLRVAAGEPLPLAQSEIGLKGHAIEARICAEDPDRGFEPQTGPVLFWRPERRIDVRVESGIEEGCAITPFYDSMVAKVIAHGRDRAEAIRRLAKALADWPLLGMPTNQRFLSHLLETDEFLNSKLSADTLDAWLETNPERIAGIAPTAEHWAIAAALHAQKESDGNWFCSRGEPSFKIELTCGEERKNLRYTHSRDGKATVGVDGALIGLRLERKANREIDAEIDGVRRRGIAVWEGDKLHLSMGGSSFIFVEREDAHAEENKSDGRSVLSPVAGVLTRVLVERGQGVSAGQTLALIEAMKMETRVVANRAGIVMGAHARQGSQVASGALLFEIEAQIETGHG